MASTETRPDPRVSRTRGVVTRTAAELLLDGGVGAVTIEAVVQRSGVARSTIYRHWPTRTDVVATAFAHLMTPMPVAPTTGTLAERLRLVVLPKAAEMSQDGYATLIPSLLSEAGRDPELREFHEQFVANQQAALTDVLVQAVDAGALPTDLDVGRACSQMLGPLMFERLIFGRPVDPGFAEQMIDGFLATHATSARPGD